MQCIKSGFPALACGLAVMSFWVLYFNVSNSESVIWWVPRPWVLLFLSKMDTLQLDVLKYTRKVLGSFTIFREKIPCPWRTCAKVRKNRIRN